MAAFPTITGMIAVWLEDHWRANTKGSDRQPLRYVLFMLLEYSSIDSLHFLEGQTSKSPAEKWNIEVIKKTLYNRREWMPLMRKTDVTGEYELDPESLYGGIYVLVGKRDWSVKPNTNLPGDVLYVGSTHGHGY